MPTLTNGSLAARLMAPSPGPALTVRYLPSTLLCSSFFSLLLQCYSHIVEVAGDQDGSKAATIGLLPQDDGNTPIVLFLTFEPSWPPVTPSVTSSKASWRDEEARLFFPGGPSPLASPLPPPSPPAAEPPAPACWPAPAPGCSDCGGRRPASTRGAGRTGRGAGAVKFDGARQMVSLATSSFCWAPTMRDPYL